MDLTRKKLLSAFPKGSELFDHAVDSALSRIRLEASLVRQGPRPMPLKRALGWGLVLLLLLAGVLGVAEGIRLGVFDFFPGKDKALPQAQELSRSDFPGITLGKTEIKITESVFDGATLRFVMSIAYEGLGRPLLQEELWDPDSGFQRQLAQDGVTALGSFDWFTVNGEEYPMTGGSGGETVPGPGNGEALLYFELKLSSGEGVSLPQGDFTLGLPVRRYDLTGQDPGLSKENAQFYLPVSPVPLDSIADVAPKLPVPMGPGTLTVLEARLSPLKVYTTLRLDFPQEAPPEECAPYLKAWSQYTLADEQGRVVTADSFVWGWGLPQGETDPSRHLLMQGEFPPAARYPDRMFLAPLAYGADGAPAGRMDMAVELRPAHAE